MNNQPRQVLIELIAKHGTSLSEDPRRVEAFLKDLSGEHKREIFVLVNALKSNVAHSLLASQSAPPEIVLPRLTRSLEENLALAEDAARWGVETWAMALGILEYNGQDVPLTPDDASSNMPTLVVSQDDRGQYHAINAAIQAAAPDTVILIEPGVYEEHVILDRAVSLIGHGRAADIVIKTDDMICLEVKTEEALVRGLTFHSDASFEDENRPIVVDIPQGNVVLEDCDISGGGDCIRISGETTNPTIKNCQIHHGKQSGVLVTENGLGVIESCDIFANAYAGVTITDGGNPTVTDCKIHDGEIGVAVGANGLGVIENCDIFANAYPGVVIAKGGNPTVKDCKIHDGERSGVFVMENGRGVIENCDIFANASAGVGITTGGNPTVKDCKIHDGKSNGVVVTENGRGVIENCDIFANAYAGVKIAAGGNPTVKDCKIHDGEQNGVAVVANGLGVIENCDIFANVYPGIGITDGGNPTVKDCKIHDGKNTGIFITNGAKGRIQYCIIYMNDKEELHFDNGFTTIQQCIIDHTHPVEKPDFWNTDNEFAKDQSQWNIDNYLAWLVENYPGGIDEVFDADDTTIEADIADDKSYSAENLPDNSTDNDFSDDNDYYYDDDNDYYYDDDYYDDDSIDWVEDYEEMINDGDSPF